MKLNKSCIRDILLYVEEHCVYITDSLDRRVMYNVSFDELSEKLYNYSSDDIRYSIVVLAKSDFIVCDFIPENSILEFDYAHISNLTPSGHNLLDNIRSDSLWDKIKKKLSEEDNLSLDRLFKTSEDVLDAYIKSKI